MFQRFINWYAQRFPFPSRGYGLFHLLLKKTGNENAKFTRRLHNGYLMHVYPAKHIDRIIFWHGYYEKKFVLLWESLIRENDTVVDAGANIGYYSLVASKKAGKGMVYAFEPFSGNRVELIDNILLNRLKNIQVSPLAISNEMAEKTLYVSAAENRGMTGLKEPSNYNGATEIIKATTLDHWAYENRIDRINLIKIDIEGAEYDALEGMGNILTRMKPLLFIEVQASLLEKYRRQPADIYRLLARYHYKAYAVLSKNVLKEIKTPCEDELVLFLPPGYILPGEIRIENN